MRPVSALALLTGALITFESAAVRAQTGPPPPPSQPQSQSPKAAETTVEAQNLGDAASSALELLTGAASLGTIASCRSGTYGDEAPVIAGFVIGGELRDPEPDLRALLEASVPWTKKGRPYTEDACR